MLISRKAGPRVRSLCKWSESLSKFSLAELVAFSWRQLTPSSSCALRSRPSRRSSNHQPFMSPNYCTPRFSPDKPLPQCVKKRHLPRLGYKQYACRALGVGRSEPTGCATADHDSPQPRGKGFAGNPGATSAQNIGTTVRYTHVGYEQTRQTAEALSHIFQ